MKTLYKTCRAKTRFGDELECFKNDYITRQIFRHGVYARDELTILVSLFSLMPSRRAALDIGGNIGNHCAIFSRHFQETHALEPHPEVFEVLSRNIERNGWKAKACQLGFSDQDGLVKLFIFEDGNLGRTTVANSHAGRSVDIAVTTGDAFVRKNIFEPVDFIKIDVESHEGSVIKGLKATIKAFQPVITMEWNDQTTRDYFQRNNLFADVLEGYRQLAIYSRWTRSLWPGVIGKVRRRMSKIRAKWGHGAYVSAFDPNKDSEAVILIPRRHEALIAPLQAAHPF